MDQRDEQFQSHLLRLCRPGPQAAWRVILESIPGGVPQGFASLEAAFAFLAGPNRAPGPALEPDSLPARPEDSGGPGRKEVGAA